MANEDVVGVVDDVTGTTVYATFLGAGGEMFGFLGYDGPEGWRSFADVTGGSGDPLDQPYSQHALSAWLSDRDGLDPRMVRLIKQAGLKPRGRNAWPEVLVHRPGLVPHVPDDAHAGLVARVLPISLILAETMRDARPGRSDEILVHRGGDARRERRPPVMRTGLPLPAADPMTLARATKQGRTGGAWHLDHWTLPTPIADRDPPWYPRQAIVREIPRGLVLDMDVLAPDAHPDAAARDLLLRLVGERGRPDRVVARRESVLRALEPLSRMFELVRDPDPSWSLQLSESMGAALQRSARGRTARQPTR
jgi:hypothetical protein